MDFFLVQCSDSRCAFVAAIVCEENAGEAIRMVQNNYTYGPMIKYYNITAQQIDMDPSPGIHYVVAKHLAAVTRDEVEKWLANNEDGE